MFPRNQHLLYTLLLLLSNPISSDAFHLQTPFLVERPQMIISSFSALRMQPSAMEDRSTSTSSSSTSSNTQRRRLSAVSVQDEWEETNPVSSSSSSLLGGTNSWFEGQVWPILSTSLMITGNTVGAGMLVLPDLARGPGMAISSSIFIAAFVINLISGLLIADVAIRQHYTSGNDVPSSFKEFAQVNLQSDMAANGISMISIMVNALVMAFNIVKVGDLGADMMMMTSCPSMMISMIWSVACFGLVASTSFASLSTVTSILVTGLFASFAGLLLPGLAHLTSDTTTSTTTTTTVLVDLFTQPGTAPDLLASTTQLAPIILMSLVYQNIVPTVTKLLNYNRFQTTAAIALGSFLPLCMYIAWTVCVVGGGVNVVDNAASSSGLLLTMFSLTTIAGSSIGCIMSLSEEFDSFLKKPKAEEQENKNNVVAITTPTDRFSTPAVLASVGCAMVAAQVFADDLTSTLQVAGSVGSPLLYGVLPVLMAYQQRQSQDVAGQQQSQQNPLYPTVGLGLLGAAGFVGNDVLSNAQDVLSTMTSI